MPKFEESDLLTLREVADHFRITTATLRSLIGRGDIKAVKIGRLWRIRQTEIDRYMRMMEKR